jgi:DNA-binding transcriptional MerR regulator/methylmalonyl-CoA mutase cobalamin-binding subunit
MPRYSLGAVARLLNVTPHLLRAWERRYGAVQPGRTAGGTRRYSEADVRRLRLLRAGIEAGHPISEIAALSLAALERRFGSSAQASAAPLGDLLRSVERLDAQEVERRLGQQLAALGPRDFARRVALPLLEEMGVRWGRGDLCIAAEHATSAILRSLLGGALRFPRGGGGPTLLFATPAGERHELGLLIAALCAQERGARVLYLGPDLPADEIARALRESGGADAVVVAAVSLEAARAAALLAELRRAVPAGVPLWVGGSLAASLPALPGVRQLADLDDLEQQVDLLAARGPRALG